MQRRNDTLPAPLRTLSYLPLWALVALCDGLALLRVLPHGPSGETDGLRPWWAAGGRAGAMGAAGAEVFLE